MEQSKTFIKAYKRRNILIERGSKEFLFSKNKEYIDFLSGISINNLGYSNKLLIKAGMNQMKKIIHPSNYYLTKPQDNLAKLLIKASGLDKVFFANSGTEANEAALLFIAKYGEQIHKNELLIVKGTFLGRTYGSRIAQIGGRIGTLDIKVIERDSIEDFIKNVNENTLGIWLELVQGHGGILKLNKKYIDKIKMIARKKGLLIIIDEVQTGLGRTGNIFAFESFKINPDILTLGKSLGGGFPLSAVIVKEKISTIINPGDYGCTMGGNSVACAMGIKLLEYLLDKRNIDKIKIKGKYLNGKLQELKRKYRFIDEIRGMGMMQGIKLKSVDKAKKIINKCIERGILLDIVNQDVIRLLPPFIISKKSINFGMKEIFEAMYEVENGL